MIASRVNEGQRREIEAHSEQLGIADRVLLTGLVSDPVLVLLYQSAELVVFPSFYEGFGLPVLEARRCGARVICSNNASLPEVMLETSAVFNPHSIGEITQVMRAGLDDPATMVRLDRAADPGFSWDLAAERLVGVYDRVMQRSVRACSPDRPRLAVVADLASDDDDEVFVGDGLIDELRECADVTVFVRDRPPYLEQQTDVAVAGLRTLNARCGAGDVDHVIHFVGPEAFDHGPSGELVIVPGHVVIVGDGSTGEGPDATRSEDIVAGLYRAIARFACSVFVLDDGVADRMESETGTRPEVLDASVSDSARGRRIVDRLDQFG